MLFEIRWLTIRFYLSTSVLSLPFHSRVSQQLAEAGAQVRACLSPHPQPTRILEACQGNTTHVYTHDSCLTLNFSVDPFTQSPAHPPGREHKPFGPAPCMGARTGVRRCVCRCVGGYAVQALNAFFNTPPPAIIIGPLPILQETQSREVDARRLRHADVQHDQETRPHTLTTHTCRRHGFHRSAGSRAIRLPTLSLNLPAGGRRV